MPSGSLSNHNPLREILRKRCENFQTENDSGVAAGYFARRMREGHGIDRAIMGALRDFDGFYTFAIRTGKASP